MTNLDNLFIGLAEIKRECRERVFDWDKAAKIILERKPYEAWAGLGGDFGNTGDVIYEENNIVTGGYTYLSSYWATPKLLLMDENTLGFEDGEHIPCWKWKDETEWDAHTVWPQSAVNILKGVSS